MLKILNMAQDLQSRVNGLGFFHCESGSASVQTASSSAVAYTWAKMR